MSNPRDPRDGVADLKRGWQRAYVDSRWGRAGWSTRLAGWWTRWCFAAAAQTRPRPPILPSGREQTTRWPAIILGCIEDTFQNAHWRKPRTRRDHFKIHLLQLALDFHITSLEMWGSFQNCIPFGEISRSRRKARWWWGNAWMETNGLRPDRSGVGYYQYWHTASVHEQIHFVIFSFWHIYLYILRQ